MLLYFFIAFDVSNYTFEDHKTFARKQRISNISWYLPTSGALFYFSFKLREEFKVTQLAFFNPFRWSFELAYGICFNRNGVVHMVKQIFVAKKMLGTEQIVCLTPLLPGQPPYLVVSGYILDVLSSPMQ